MAHVRTVARKDGSPAYEVRRRDRGRHRQRTFPTKRAADRFALRVENELAEGETTEVYVRRGRTVAEVVEASQASARRIKDKTRAGYEQAYRIHILPTFGPMRVAEVTSEDVERWVAALQDKGLAASSVRGAYIALNKVFRYAQRHRLVKYNPCAGVELPAKDTAEPTSLTPGQVEALAAQLDAYPPYGLLVRFAAYTGLRAGEIAGLRVRDVNLLRRHVEVRRTVQRVKGGWSATRPKSERSSRNVPLRADLLAALDEYLADHPRRHDRDAPLWPGRVRGGHADGKSALDWERPFDHQSFYRYYFRPALVRAGLFDGTVVRDSDVWRATWRDDAGQERTATFDREHLAVRQLSRNAAGGIRFHDLRHTYASILAAAGVDIYKVSRWMGHASINTTDSIYTHLFHVDHTDDMARVDAYVKSAPVVSKLQQVPDAD